uniref:Glutamate decarboxylase n=1 Tax=Chromera velia CCMP2878 TaxID=1169474 RepID=A0A0G4F0K1_9ALVE|mmetsp:Transcript_13266/g.26170  ORF Transcript_13266/g.26170 Transcript_13266/m.26170 type:complete len:607 (-) Transcript_13266:340-2160(-)|eukprot:Cvel_14494.t1-p1 / transcript=Cvel_14494.t1 / gene=Cvel_14494 / organism=Chromera_velia_CCMP2878 / gene_product=Glutamate decarboxylase, putative / transcript_product=Glutamate decarboxylase, putative / location=Cvel_scaffold1033:39188-44135(+) / protein_length=606 / sequence_SO=supercontig / SO=protein_coding / is_pseudo=false
MATENEVQRQEIERLKRQISEMQHHTTTMREDSYFYASQVARKPPVDRKDPRFPSCGLPGRFVKQLIVNTHLLDSNEYLNTSSYVNVVFEPEESEIAKLGLSINIADQTVYPWTFRLHDDVVNMIADLWHCPRLPATIAAGVFAGAGTVGSTEACLLAGLALKFRWRTWYAQQKGLSEAEVRREYPNMIISSMYQACWEKLFRYLDIEPRLVHPRSNEMAITAADVEPFIDDHTIGVVCILGNHYSGHYDPVKEVDALLQKVNEKKNLQVGIHVDAASGGFIAPFQEDVEEWDFRLPNVLSISTSGHKFGESCCGTGWVVWRQKEDLSEHVSCSVTYLGGQGDSYTLNFSRPASGIMVQYYKILRLGKEGYKAKVRNQHLVAKQIRDGLKRMKCGDAPRFRILDAGDFNCLPVVTAMLNPDLKLPYDDIDLQHTIGDDQWYVSGYRMQFNHPHTEELCALFKDMIGEQTMFRIVCKSNLTLDMADALVEVIERAVGWLDCHVSHSVSMFTLAEQEEQNGTETADKLRDSDIPPSPPLPPRIASAPRMARRTRRETAPLLRTAMSVSPDAFPDLLEGAGAQSLVSTPRMSKPRFGRTGSAIVGHVAC